MKTGAGEWTRTIDLLITNQLLYQLSYTGLGRNLNPSTAAERKRAAQTFTLQERERSERPERSERFEGFERSSFYFIAILISPSFVSMSSADVSGRTILSMAATRPVLSM